MKEISFFKNINDRKNDRKKILKQFNIKNINQKQLMNYCSFGKTYFDNDKIDIGYGKYEYDGRFKKNVKEIIKHFKLKKNSRILEIGCAKGFLLVEFFKQDMKVEGLEKSKYAKENSHKIIKKFIRISDIEKEKIYSKNKFFDFVICKEVFPHIHPKRINSLIQELNKVVKNQKNIYLFIQTFKKDNQKKLFKKWDITHKSNYNRIKWKQLLKKNNFKGSVGFKYLF